MLGTWCHEWPNFVVNFNDSTYFDGPVQGEITVEIDAPVLDHNLLRLTHHGKRFGEQGIWDTETQQEHIMQDRAVRLLGIEIDDVDISKYVWRHCPLITADHGAVLTDYYGFNGTVSIDFASPVYHWMIDHIVRHESRKLLDISQPIETSYDNLFEYDQDELELLELEKLLQQHAHLFGKRSTL